MSGHGYTYGHDGQPGGSSGQTSAHDSDLFGRMEGLSLGTDTPWIHDEPPRGYSAIVAVNKGIYHSLEDTGGALQDKSDNVEDVESRELENKIAEFTNGQQVSGWSRNHWNNCKLVGMRRMSRRGGSGFNPVHLQYAISRSRAVYAIKNANLRDNYEQVVHLIFYNVKNWQAWTAMQAAINMKGVVLPEYPEKSMFEEASSSRTSSRQSRTGSNFRGQGSRPAAKKPHRLRPASVSITANDVTAWNALHTDNPFAKTVNRLCQDEFRDALIVVGYTVIAVAQERLIGPQSYWNALVAHFAPATLVKATGQGKGVQADTRAQTHGGRAY